jgi:glutathione S-transferase
MTTVYGYSVSGNCHKVRLLLEQLGQDYRWIEIDSSRGETRTPQYLAKNPNGKVPVLELEDGSVLVESNAILCYLAEGTSFLPQDRWQKAQALGWMFFEQYSHEPYVAVARMWTAVHPDGAPSEAALAERRRGGDVALDAMESHLTGRSFLVGDRISLADVALYAYTHVAEEGGFDLTSRPALTAWLARVAATPGHIPIDA